MMDFWTGWEVLRPIGEALGAELRELVTTLRTDPMRLGALWLYPFAIMWLVYLWRTRHQARREEQRTRGMAVMGGVVRIFGAVALLFVGVLMSLARVAGRSHERW
jgi:hypothetical protein